MDKSPHNNTTKKVGKSLKEKRADKKAKTDNRSAADAVEKSVTGSRRSH